MKNEIEATFYEIDKEQVRAKLKELGAELIRPEILMRRKVYNTGGHSFARVRDEGGKVVMTYKNFTDDSSIMGVKEVNLTVDNYDDANNFMLGCGLRQKAEQETYREVWLLDGVEICIDTWPWIPSFIEIEGPSEDAVWSVAQKLGYDKKEAHFGGVDTAYNFYYGVEKDVVNYETPVINFEIEAPSWAQKRIR